MSDIPVTPEFLASALAARLIHDAMGPASGIVSAFSLISDPTLSSMRDEALALADDSARKLVKQLTLSRIIYGGGVMLSTAELRVHATSLFEGTRAQLMLRVDDDTPTVGSARIFLGLLQIMAASAAAGGDVNATHSRRAADNGYDEIIVAIDATGPRVRLPEEVYAGLAERPSNGGLAHRWSSAYFVGALARSTGGTIEGGGSGGAISFRAVLRAEIASI